MVAAALGLGLYSATRHAYVKELHDRAARLEREREQQRELSAAAERARITREMHDIVAHHLAVMIALSDGAAAASAPSAPRAAEAMRTVSATGRQALADTRRLLSGPAEAADKASGDRQPLPDLSGLDALIAGVRAAGLPVSYELQGSPALLSAGVQLTVFRLIQEALTNTLKHGGAGASAVVRLSYLPGEVHLDVEDDGAGARAPQPDTTGRGLAGMRQRVQTFGGEVQAGPGPQRAGGCRPGWAGPGDTRVIRVLLVDDQSLLRMGFRMILEAETDMTVIGEAGDGAAGVSMAAALQPDVVLMDVRMPGTDGIEATAAITAAGGPAKVLILTTYDLDQYVYAGLRAGASGFLLKDAPPADLLAAIRTVAGGEAVLAPSTTRRLIDRFVPLLPDPERTTRRDSLLERPHRAGT